MMDAILTAAAIFAFVASTVAAAAVLAKATTGASAAALQREALLAIGTGGIVQNAIPTRGARAAIGFIDTNEVLK